MRYMMLIYSKERPDGLDREAAAQIYSGHMAVMKEAGRKGVLVGAEPLAPTSTECNCRRRALYQLQAAIAALHSQAPKFGA